MHANAGSVAWPQIPLEDAFADVLHKALRGTGTSPERAAAALGLDASLVRAWLDGRGAANAAQAHALARLLHLDADALADCAAARWYPPAIERDDVRHHPQDPHPSNGYVFFLEGGRRAALVDPAGIPANLLRILRDGAYHLEYLLVTHKHADHCDATADIAAAFPDAKIVMHERDMHALGALGSRVLRVRDGEDVPFGDDARIRMLHTPGHTDGSVCYLFNATLFSGDTLFAASVGGAYGDVSTYADILNSIRSKLFTLPDDTVVMPGHGPPTRIGLEKAHNPFF